MTDGIIQQAYRRIAIPLMVEIDGIDVPVIPQQMVDDTFRELIEKIEQELTKPSYSSNWIYCRKFVLQKLIGDNQE